MKPIPVSPGDDRVYLGDRLRAARQARSLTIDEVAKMSGLTKGSLSRIERDEHSPSVASLVAVCRVLSLPVGKLFAEPEVELVTAQDAPLVSLATEGAIEHLLTPRGQSKVQVLKSVVAPGGNGGEKLYTMIAEVEVLHVIEGTIEVQFSQHSEDVHAGSTLTFKGEEPHTWRNPSGTDSATAIWIITPAGWNV